MNNSPKTSPNTNPLSTTENEGEQSSVSSKREPDSKTYEYKVWKLDEDCGDDYIYIAEPRLDERTQDWYIVNEYKLTKSPSITENEGKQSSESSKREPDFKSASVKDISHHSKQDNTMRHPSWVLGWDDVNTVKDTNPLSTTENEGEQSSESSKREPDSKSARVKDRTVSHFSLLSHGGGVSLPYPQLRPLSDVVFGNTAFSHASQQQSPSRSFSGDGQIQRNVAEVIGWPPLKIKVNNVKCHECQLLECNKETNNLRKNNNLQLDEETYELEKKNAMIIFNHETFFFCEERQGTAKDVAALEETFKQFRFHVTTHNDLTVKELFDKLEEFSQNDFNDYGCICVAILTHGRDGGFLMARDTEYSERDVFSCFNPLTKRTLAEKPIIFLIQACRGSAAAPGVPCGRGQHVEFDAPKNTCIPIEANMIIFYSSFFGRASARDKEKGTWFIQTVCEQMKLYGSIYHLEDLFRIVRRIVALDMESIYGKQMPTVTTTLLKKLYLKK